MGTSAPRVSCDVAGLVRLLLRSLRRIDGEATTRFPDNRASGKSWGSGLRQYHEHHNRVHGTGLGCEPAWSQRIAALLLTEGLSARAEVRYPSYALPPEKSWQSCDLRVDLDRGPMWVEVKGSWPVCFRARADGIEPYVWRRYKSYLLDATREDFEKLSRLSAPDASDLGVLLVGFDTALRKLDADVATMVGRCGPGWRGGEIDSWDEAHYGTRARVWLWTRAVEGAAATPAR